MATESSKSEKRPNFDVDWFLRDKLPEVLQSPVNSGHAVSLTPPKEQEESLHNRLQNQLTASSQQPDEQAGYVLQRSKSLPLSNTHEKKKGFFKKIFSSKKEAPQTLVTKNVQPRAKEQSVLSSPPPQYPQYRQRSKSVPVAELDPRLERFLNYYREKGLDQLQKDLEPTKSEESSILSSTEASIAAPNKSPKTDVLGRPIPPHPPKAPLPSALVKNSHYQKNLADQRAHLDSNPVQSSSRLSFLRRHLSTDQQQLSRASSVQSSAKNLEISPPHETKSVTIPGLENLSKMKVVAFDIPVFVNDPPQQIPSRTPRKGEVEVMPDGSIIIHKLTAAERRHIMSTSGGGVVVGGSGPLKIITKQQGEEEGEGKPKADAVSSPSSSHSGSDMEDDSDGSVESDEDDKVHDAQKHSIEVAVAATAASARGKQAPNELTRTVTNHEDEVGVDTEATKINIDKPMMRHKSSVSLSTATIDIVDEINSGKAKVPLDVLYTRCCHLREILPIPTTLKQLKPGSTDPVSVLQLRNPKPSLVEILTFSDFLSVAPVLCVSLDGVSLSTDMFRIILSSLAHKKELEKLTLRNTPIDEMGWKLLCWFLTKNKTISRIDLSQVPALKLNVQKPSKAASPNIKRMECDLNSRSDMNWNLFNAVLVSRGGIDELVLNGAKMSDQHFKNLIELGVSLNTTKLGLAYNDLTAEQCDILANYLNFDKLTGLDLAYNDLAGKLRKFVNLKIKASSSLRFISLNSTNLTDSNGEVSHMVSDFLMFKNLSYIDLSNNKKLFPQFMMTLSEVLPILPKLRRILLDDNNLNQEALVMFSEFIPFCKSLSHISLTGNSFDAVSAGALCSALKISDTIVTVELDYENFPPKFGQEIALYTVRNMQNEVYGKNEPSSDLKGLQEELSQLLISDESDKERSKLIESFIKRSSKIRNRIRETIEDLFKLRIQGELNVEGKETLIRFCFIDASIEKGLKLLEKKASISNLSSEIEKQIDHPEVDRNLADEDMNSVPMSRGHSAFAQLSAPFASEHGNVELLPFGVSQNFPDNEQAEAEEIKDESKARATDTHHIKEEASMLKLSNMINSDLSKTMSKEDIQKMQDLSQNISGEKFREILLKSGDLNNVIETLDSLKKRGIPLKEIYQKDPHDDGLVLEKLKNCSAKRSSESNGSDETVFHELEADVSDTASSSGSGEERLDHAYDDILDHLVRVRTAT